MPEITPSAPLILSDVIEAVEFVSASQIHEFQAYICKRTGRILCMDEGLGSEHTAELPDDPVAAGFVAVPHKHDLDLGKPLALNFVADELPALLGEARDIFRRKGAYRRFKDLVQAQGKLECWYAYEACETEAAVRSWCEEVGLPLDDTVTDEDELSEAPIHEVPCEQCRTAVPDFEMTYFGSNDIGYRNLCSRCCNEEIAREAGSKFDHVAFQPVHMSDARGNPHNFHFVLRHLSSMLSLEALEVKGRERIGYEFRVHGSADAAPFILMQRLLERMRRDLSTTYLVEGEQGLGISGTTVRGQISCDPEAADRLPVLVIDGREVSWDEFGRMLMTFEGWKMHLEIEEPSDEV
ncbi:hypothetical protein K3M67_18095 (plasmid) [Sphingobium sp. V4]|uniref:DUF7713 domain-containing protein n=1 Tax=Sphingobium sp. V4 TaxID=3038927 RepID=UPI0025582247|nr:hypothetical protein [Sphingobium sp. V4]WIW90957.1 hypothetical protein K3M67_18095 [Sphingobium sp. V4]